MSALAASPSFFRTGTSGYIVDRIPHRFGGKQEEYLNQVKSIVSSTVEIFRKTVDEKKDLVRFFHELLASLGQERQRIAIKAGTKNAENYGVRRDDDSSFQSIGVITGLFKPYEEYNKRLLPVIQNNLRGLDRTLREFKQKELKINTGSCLGRTSCLDISILSAENSKEWAPIMSLEYYLKLCQISGAIPLEEPFEVNKFFNDLENNKTAMIKLKQISFADYKKLKLVKVLLYCYHKFEGRKSDWVLATVRSSIDGKMVALTQYVTWMNRDFRTDPVEHMIEENLVVKNGEIKKVIHRNSEITLLHQDPFLIDMTLKDVANLFKQAIENVNKDLSTLLNIMASLRYLYAHAMPFVRGSAAIGEWLELAIYSYHGYEVEYQNETLIDMEALTLSLKDFVKLYPSMLKLTKV